MKDAIAILDFGSQYAQLIARKVREAQVYCELFPWDAAAEQVLKLEPKGFILSGGPASVYEPGAPFVPAYVLQSGLPILGICYGMQALAYALGGAVKPSQEHEYGPAEIETLHENPLIQPGYQRVWMSHGDRIETPPEGFAVLGRSANSPVAFIGDLERQYYGLQFHPEVHHTPSGAEILRRFVIEICGASPEWTPDSIIADSLERIRRQVGSENVLSAVSGGVDSSVATALVQKAMGCQLAAVFVDTGMLRQGEAAQVRQVLQEQLGIELICVEAESRFLEALRGVTAPEEKRRIIGELFIRIFEEQARQLSLPRFLVQGTIYPDVVESSAPERAKAERIKTHHNVGGLPADMSFELVEPLRYLFKDEVRLVGEALGLPHSMVWRQPFPGPGLGVRCLGEVTAERLERLRQADAILRAELEVAGLLRMDARGEQVAGTAQAFAVLLPVQSVGVMGDKRTYNEVIALRAVTTEDFMTADWARLPAELLARISNRIVNEVAGVNRVVYDITSKPPATIEWE
ncbi:MAG: GMP synthase (glutamine-hydrolyzing) [Anaerolineae bacterium UTCFX2]|nr:MAG: GMP synthase (glutamine-hydrolyzing) [Anaerolineae bacterium UTCFX2]